MRDPRGAREGHHSRQKPTCRCEGVEKHSLSSAWRQRCPGVVEGPWSPRGREGPVLWH